MKNDKNKELEEISKELTMVSSILASITKNLSAYIEKESMRNVTVVFQGTPMKSKEEIGKLVASALEEAETEGRI